jgi:copper chaperone CopZ
MTSTVLNVQGLTCGHCVASVTEELQGLDGVTSVDVALVKGGVSTVTVLSTEPLEPAATKAAITEAGYSLVE